MLLLNPEINQMRQIRTNFVFKCLVLTSTSVCEGSFPWLFKVVTWLCQLMPVHDKAEPLLSEPFRGGSSTHMCMAYQGQWTMHHWYCLWGEGSGTGTKGSSLS